MATNNNYLKVIVRTTRSEDAWAYLEPDAFASRSNQIDGSLDKVSILHCLAWFLFFDDTDSGSIADALSQASALTVKVGKSLAKAGEPAMCYTSVFRNFAACSLRTVGETDGR